MTDLTSHDNRPDDVSIVVPSYRRSDYLAKCLLALRDQTIPPKEIIVVRRHDDVETKRIVDHADCRSVVIDEPGVLAAMAAGARASHGAIIGFVDDDAFPRPQWLAILSQHFRDPTVGAVGGRDVIASPTQAGPLTHRVGLITPWGRLIGNHHLGIGPPRLVDVLKGANMLFRRRALALPRTLRGRGAQAHYEIATCLWAQRQGWQLVFDPAGMVDHVGAPRFDADDRVRPEAVAIESAAYNLVAAMVSLRPSLALRRASYGLIVGDGAAPGLLRGASAALQGRRDLARRTIPSLRGQLAALIDHAAGRNVEMLEFASFDRRPT